MNQNHIQGNSTSKYRYGLYYKDELVSLMTFGSLRKNLGYKNTEGMFELIRFCNKLNFSINGSASKLFNHAIKSFQFKEIISYADRSWSQGSLYKTLGFSFVRKTKPNYWYVLGDKRENRFKYRKNVLISEGYDSTKTEHEIMLERKIYRIYDSGSYLFSYK